MNGSQWCLNGSPEDFEDVFLATGSLRPPAVLRAISSLLVEFIGSKKASVHLLPILWFLETLLLVAMHLVTSSFRLLATSGNALVTSSDQGRIPDQRRR